MKSANLFADSSLAPKIFATFGQSKKYRYEKDSSIYRGWSEPR